MNANEGIIECHEADLPRVAKQNASHRHTLLTRAKYWIACRKQSKTPTLAGHLLTNAQSPIVDVDGNFLYLAINKNAQTSIVRNVLSNRVLVNKDNPRRHWRELSRMTARLDKVYKFAIVRNPWDRFVSTFEYLRKHKMIDTAQTFEQFVLAGDFTNAHFNFQHPNFCFDNQIFVDDLYRLEDLPSEWESLTSRLGIKAELPFENRSRDNRDYLAHYTDVTRQIVSNVYREDIELLGYEFE